MEIYQVKVVSLCIKMSIIIAIKWNFTADILSNALQLYQSKNLPAEVSKLVCGSLLLKPLRNSLFSSNFFIPTFGYEIHRNMS